MNYPRIFAWKAIPSGRYFASASRVAGEPDAGLSTYYLMLLLVLIAISIPLWIVKYPGMTDYPNHLTRCYILAHYHENPLWQQRYSIDHTPVPNLAIDLVVVPLAKFLPLLVSGKIFLTLMAAIYVLGCSEVGRAVTGKPNWLALACAFTFYNTQLLMGFVNFIFGLGVFLCAFALWLRVRNRMAPWSFCLCCLLSIVAFLAHLSSVMLLGVACFTIALFDLVRNRKLLVFFANVAWLACPVVLMVAFMKGSGRVGAVDWHSFLPTINKLSLILSPIGSSSQLVKRVCEVVLLLFFLAILKGSKVHRTMAVALVFLALFLFSPESLFASHYVAERYAVPCFLLLLLSIEPRWGGWQKAAFGLLLAAMMLRVGNITANWIAMSRDSEKVVALGQVLPRGASVFVVKPVGDAVANPPDQEAGLFHVIQLWTVSRDADISTLFALAGQQPLVFRQSYCHSDITLSSANMECFPHFDFIWIFDPSPAYSKVLLGMATPAAAWDKFTLWRVNRPAVLSAASAAGARGLTIAK